MRRWLPIAAAIAILVLVAALYKSKTDAGDTRARIAELTQDVKQERQKVRTLRAEVAHMESPARVEDLANQNLDLETGAEAVRRAESEIDETLPAPRRAESKAKTQE